MNEYINKKVFNKYFLSIPSKLTLVFHIFIHEDENIIQKLVDALANSFTSHYFWYLLSYLRLSCQT